MHIKKSYAYEDDAKETEVSENDVSETEEGEIEDKRKVKVVIVKGDGNKNYTMKTPETELYKVLEEPISLPLTLELQTFYYNNQYYWLEQKTGYLFLPNFKADPVGKIMNLYTDINQSDSSYQLADKKIIWYYHRRVV